MLIQSLRLFCCFLLVTPTVFAQFGGGAGGLGGHAGPGFNTSGFSINSPSDKLTEELNKQSKIEFLETPLSDVVAFLSDLHEITIILEINALEEAGVTPDEEVSLTIEGIPLHQALDLLLSPLELTYIGEGDVLKITSQEWAASTFELRHYDVSDLLKGDMTEDAMIEMIIATTHVDWVETDGVGGNAVIRDGLMVISQTQQAHRKISDILALYRSSREEQLEAAAKVTSVVTYRLYGNQPSGETTRQSSRNAKADKEIPASDESNTRLAEKLAEIIPEMISPESWENAQIHAVGGAIIIKQTGDVHLQVKQMLSPFMQQLYQPSLMYGDGGMAQPLQGFGGGAGGGFY